MSKSLIFPVKSFLGKFGRLLAIFFWSHCLPGHQLFRHNPLSHSIKGLHGLINIIKGMNICPMQLLGYFYAQSDSSDTRFCETWALKKRMAFCFAGSSEKLKNEFFVASRRCSSLKCARSKNRQTWKVKNRRTECEGK